MFLLNWIKKKYVFMRHKSRGLVEKQHNRLETGRVLQFDAAPPVLSRSAEG